MKMAWPILIIAFGAALDLAAKLWARASLEPYGAATEFLPFVALRLTFNHGVSFSLLSFEGEIARLTLLHCTLVPGIALAPDATPLQPDTASLRLELAGLETTLVRCIVGGIRAHPRARFAASDSVTTMQPISSETRDPYSSRDRRSRPTSSVPSG